MNDQITNRLSVDDASDRPLVTFALFAYNQEKYIREAVEGALAQTYSPLEIILSDDCSSDGTFEVMKRAAAEYKGPHRVVLNRNPKNLNIGDHVNTVAKLAQGNLVVLAAGDDISRPDRTEILVERWLKNDCPPAVLYSDFEPINSDSQPVVLFNEDVYGGPFNKFEMARGNVRVLGATTAIAKCVFSKFPLINSSVRHEDRVLPFRALLLGGKVEFVNEKLIRYRVDGGISRSKTLTARHYLFEYLPAWANRTLPDAIQRLADLEMVEPNNVALRRLCEMTIAEQNMYIELPRARWLGVEAAFLKGIYRGVRFSPLIKLYLKRRFLPFFSFYFNSKNAH